MASMRLRFVHLLCFAGFAFAALATPAADAPKSSAEIRHIVLHSRHLGAHGIGYGERSLVELSGNILPADIPLLISLLSDRGLRTGIEFALASQCEPAILPVREAAIQHKLDFLAAQDVMDLIAHFRACSPETQAHAIAMRSELDGLRDADYAKTEEESKKRASEDARIQANGLKLLDPKQAATLSRQEREAVYHRAVKAMGINENGPVTPQQKNMLNRMYRTMVLGEPSHPKPQ